MSTSCSSLNLGNPITIPLTVYNLIKDIELNQVDITAAPLRAYGKTGAPLRIHSFIKDNKKFFVGPSSEKGYILIGQGEFKKVYSAFKAEASELLDVSQQIAMSTSKLDSDYKKSFTDNEKTIVLRLNGKNGIVPTYDITSYFTQKTHIEKLVIFQKYYNGGDLQHAFDSSEQDASSNFSVSDRYKIATDIIEGLTTIHENKIIHCDIKPENILLDKDPDSGKVLSAAITDFGFACDNEKNNSIGCSLQYLSPELHKLYSTQNLDTEDLPEASSKRDVWAMGLIFFELFKNDMPYSFIRTHKQVFEGDDDQFNQNLTILAHQINHWLPEPKDKSTIEYLVWQMLDQNPQRRISAKDAGEMLLKIIERNPNGFSNHCSSQYYSRSSSPLRFNTNHSRNSSTSDLDPLVEEDPNENSFKALDAIIEDSESEF